MLDKAHNPTQPTTWSAYGVRIAETWFIEPSAVPPAPEADVVVYNYFIAPRAQAMSSHTILVDLDGEPDAIMAQMKQDMRYKVRRAENRDGLAFEVFEPSQLRARPELLDEFLSYFNAFAREKGINTLFRPNIEYQIAANILWLTRASKDGEVLVWHAYIVDNGRARLRNSASHFRGKDSAMTNLIGRANRWVHWKGMMAFRDAGVPVYDFGGWYEGDSDVDLLRINRFKEGFGGRNVIEHSCHVPFTLKGRAFLLARSARDWLQEFRTRTARTERLGVAKPKDAPSS